jgi:hypothetical protein
LATACSLWPEECKDAKRHRFFIKKQYVMNSVANG